MRHAMTAGTHRSHDDNDLGDHPHEPCVPHSHSVPGRRWTVGTDAAPRSCRWTTTDRTGACAQPNPRDSMPAPQEGHGRGTAPAPGKPLLHALAFTRDRRQGIGAVSSGTCLWTIAIGRWKRLRLRCNSRWTVVDRTRAHLGQSSSLGRWGRARRPWLTNCTGCPR